MANMTSDEVTRPPATRGDVEDVVCRLLTSGGAVLVVVDSTTDGRYFRCEGCGNSTRTDESRYTMISQAITHAKSCPERAGDRRDTAAELAKEVAIELRAELPRIDSRAAAGVALAAAILVAIVSQTPMIQPIYALGVVSAALLTIAIALFLTVLVPAPALPSQRTLLAHHTEAEVWDAFAGSDRLRYHSSNAVETLAQIQNRQTLLRIAFGLGLLALALIAAAASIGLLMS